MSRKYDKGLVDKIRSNQYTTVKQGVEVIVKPIPDCDIVGAMDPRLYNSQKKMAMIMKFLPKSMFKLDFSEKGIAKLRKPFNNVDSTSFTEGVKQEQFTIKTRDGYDLPMHKFTSENTIDNAPVLYFIHGGGFFAGSTNVVAEALKYIVKRDGIIAYGVDYRLAPENPYPTGHEDVYEGLEWIYNNVEHSGGDKNKIYVAGDSAGGNLALYCSNRNIRENTNMVAGQIILYPTVNMGQIEDEYSKFSLDKFDIYEKQRKVIQPAIEMFASATSSLSDVLGTTDFMNLDLTPYKEVSAKMPRTLFTCGEHDALVVESLAYSKKLIDLGVDTKFTLYRGMGHAYIDHMGNYPQSEDCAIDIGNFIMERDI